jgi:hypothetical protein
MKEKISKILEGSFMTPKQTEIKTNELIFLFNEHILEKAKESVTVSELLLKAFIK